MTYQAALQKIEQAAAQWEELDRSGIERVEFRWEPIEYARIGIHSVNE
jgi:hypothetical protein